MINLDKELEAGLDRLLVYSIVNGDKEALVSLIPPKMNTVQIATLLVAIYGVALDSIKSDIEHVKQGNKILI